MNQDQLTREVLEALYGDGAYEITKAMTKQEKNQRTQARVGLASNVLGLAAGAVGTKEAYSTLQEKRGKVPKPKPITGWGKFKGKHAVGLAGAALGLQVANIGGDAVANRVLARSAKKKEVHKGFIRSFKTVHNNAAKASEHVRQASENASSATGHANRAAESAAESAKKAERLIPSRKTATLIGLGGVTAVGGTTYGAAHAGAKHGFVAAERKQKRRAIGKAQQQPVAPPKPPTPPTPATPLKAAKMKMVKTGVNVAGQGAKQAPQMGQKAFSAAQQAPQMAQQGALATSNYARRGVDYTKGKVASVTKSVDIAIRGEISKMNSELKQVFGWASVIEIGGEPVIDLQGDIMTIDTIEKAAYNYVHKSRKGGRQHQRDGEEPLHVSDMIESFVLTPEKKEQMGLPNTTPTGWWVGFQINDDDTWQQYKDGKLKEFSIHGSGTRKAMEI